MIHEERNIENIEKLAKRTKEKTYNLYNFCKKNNIEILIYETLRTKATQEEYVINGKSRTMNSWHLTGQALDWVLVDTKGKALWNAYTSTNGLKVIKYAKSIGFTSGHDWGWDSPHLQYDKLAYGSDSFEKASNPSKGTLGTDETVKAIQRFLNAKYNENLIEDGLYGEKTRNALLKALKIEYNRVLAPITKREIKVLDGVFYSSLKDVLSIHVVDEKTKLNKEFIYILQASLYVNNHKEVGEIDGVWGKNTTKALNNFKKSQGSREDGLLGGTTWKILLG